MSLAKRTPRRRLGAVVVGVLALALGVEAFACSSSSAPPPGDEGGHDAPGPDVVPRDGGRDAPRADSAVDAGAPYLTSLRVTGAADASAYTLVPAFSPGQFDYYVRCVAGANRLSVSIAASPGAKASLSMPTTSVPAAVEEQEVTVNENQAIVAVAATGSASTEYWIRCLPSNFPTLTWTLHPEVGTPTPGYYLVGNTPQASAYAMVLDGQGVPVWYYGGDAVIFNVDDLVEGGVSFATTGSFQYEVNYLSPSKVVLLRDLVEDQHELRFLPNGDYLLISEKPKSGVDLTGLTAALPDGGLVHLGKDSTIRDCDLVEVNPAGAVVWTWVATAHFDPVTATTWPLVQPEADGGSIVEVFHCNSIDVDPANGNLLVSGRSMDSVFYVDRATSKVLWKLGGNDSCKDDATFAKVAPASARFYRQHDARLQPGWSSTCRGGRGQLSLFDDETDRPGPARAALYDVDIHPDDGGASDDCGAPADAGANGASLVWQYRGTVSAPSEGSFRILADGSRVVGWGAAVSMGDRTFSEVDEEGQDLLDLTMDVTNLTWSYRAIKVPIDAFDLEALRRASGGSSSP